VSSRLVESTYSSRIQLPTETPPQLIPPTKLPAKLSRRGRPSAFRFGLFMDIGFAPANESCRDRPLVGSTVKPLIVADVLESPAAWQGITAGLTCWDDGELEVCLEDGVAISIGELFCIVKPNGSWGGVAG
jgi:hypothetical protein